MAPTARLGPFHAFASLHITATLAWDIQHVVIETAFLHGVLPESESVSWKNFQVSRRLEKGNWVMRLMKSTYCTA
jgi:hypothetical protein